jgi:hypothetical protein
MDVCAPAVLRPSSERRPNVRRRHDLSPSPAPAARGRQSFTSTSTAAEWARGVVTGSGRVGAIVWGNPDEHVVSLAHERFFIPANATTPPPDTGSRIDEIRRELLAGDPAGAASVVARSVAEAGMEDLIWTDPLGPTSELRISRDGVEPRDYRRHVDFATGQIALRWTDEHGANELRVSAPRGTQDVAVGLWSDGPGSVTVRLGVPRDRAAVRGESPDYRDLVTAAVSSAGPRDARLELRARHPQSGRMVCSTTRLTSSDDAVFRLADDEVSFDLQLRPGRWSRVDLTVEVDDESDHPEIELHGHETLQAASILSLGARVPGDVTTEELLERAADDIEYDLALLELAYAAGRYTIISSTGQLPATLQGVWQGTWSPPWSADYTLNGNVQNGSIASLVSTGTPELLRSLARLLLPHLDDFRTNARRVFGVEGALLPTRMSSHGLANHFSPAYPLQFWTGCGGWILRMLADAVLATGDRTFVDDDTWELVEEVLRFAATLATQDRLAPAYSPENTPLGSPTPISVDPAMDVAILRDLQRSARVLAEARGVTPIDLPDVPPRYRVEDGRLAEWSFPGQPDDVAHRHTSQLYGLWYEPDDAFDDATLRDAAAALIRDKIAWRAEAPGPPPGNMEMAFGLTQLGLAAATLGDTASLEQCIQWLTRLHFTPAMTTTHDAGRLFNIDASGGLPALVAAALVQSSRDTIHLLPARPSSWTRGSISGLTTRTGLRVTSLSWDDRGMWVELRGDADSRWVRRDGVSLRLPQPATLAGAPGAARSFRLPDGDAHTLEFTWAR